MTEYIEQLDVLTLVVREAIRRDTRLYQELPKFRHTERANLHQRLRLLVPAYKDSRTYLAQLKTSQNSSGFASAPDRLVSTLLTLFATGTVFIPETHILWNAPFPANLVEQHCTRDYGLTFMSLPYYKPSTRRLQELKASANEFRRLKDYRELLIKQGLTDKPPKTRLMEEVDQVKILRTRLKVFLKPEEFDLLRRYQKLLFADE